MCWLSFLSPRLIFGKLGVHVIVTKMSGFPPFFDIAKMFFNFPAFTCRYQCKLKAIWSSFLLWTSRTRVQRFLNLRGIFSMTFHMMHEVCPPFLLMKFKHLFCTWGSDMQGTTGKVSGNTTMYWIQNLGRTVGSGKTVLGGCALLPSLDQMPSIISVWEQKRVLQRISSSMIGVYFAVEHVPSRIL